MCSSVALNFQIDQQSRNVSRGRGQHESQHVASTANQPADVIGPLHRGDGHQRRELVLLLVEQDALSANR